MLEYSEKRQRPVVVGIGASAGGLDALIRTLREVPQNPLLSYMIVQHLDPTHESALSEILSRKTPLKLREVTDGTRVENGNLCVIPPGKYRPINDSILELREPPEPRGSRDLVPISF